MTDQAKEAGQTETGCPHIPCAAPVNHMVSAEEDNSVDRPNPRRQHRHEAMLAFNDAAVCPIVQDLHARQHTLLSRRETTARKETLLEEDVAWCFMQTHFNSHSYIVCVREPSDVESVVRRKVSRATTHIFTEEETARCMVVGEESRSALQLNLRCLYLSEVCTVGIVEGNSMLVEQHQREKRGFIVQERDASFESLCRIAETDGHIARERAEGRIRFEAAQRSALCEEERLSRDTEYIFEESCERDVLRSDFMQEVARCTSLLLWRACNVEARGRVEVEVEEVAERGALLASPDGVVVVGHIAGLLEGVAEEGRLEWREAGMRRFVVEEEAEGWAGVERSWGAQQGWRAAVQQEASGRAALVAEQTLVAQRLHSALIDSVHWNVQDARGESPTDYNPWSAVESIKPQVCAFYA